MPNHVSNRLTITGESEAVARLIADIAGDTEKDEIRAIDFNKILPMPIVLRNTGNGRNTIDGQKVSSWWRDATVDWDNPARKPDRLLTDEEQAKIAATGYPDWYEWSIANWGTKWNAYNQNRLSGGVIYFDTAWSAPIPVIEALAKKHPDVEITLEYADEDRGSNAGIVKFAAGKMTGSSDLDGSMAVKLWFDINGGDPAACGYDLKTWEYVGDDDEAA